MPTLGAIYVLAIMALASTSQAAIVTFNAAGELMDGSSLTGTVAIDTALGVATTVNIGFSAPLNLTFDQIRQQYGNSTPAYLIWTKSASHSEEFILVLPIGSLANYAGGPMCSWDTRAQTPSCLLSIESKPMTTSLFYSAVL